MNYEYITPKNYKQATFTQDDIADFLFEHLDQFGDAREDIMRCLDYSLGITEGRKGFVVVGYEDQQILGVVVINETGMKGYIPENILVYIAVHGDARGKGLGKGLMKAAMEKAEGDVALHVEPDNPARYLYEKLGFTNKYLEMRWKK